jgi:hypothetical protein
MSASANTKKQCVTCNKSGGVLICDGCQQIFCGKHVIQHRQNLAGQLDNIMQDHDLIQHDIEGMATDHLLLQNINQWEKESIAKIGLAAKTARKNLKKILSQSKERLSKTCRDMAGDIHSSREADDYSEHDFNRWIEQLNTVKSEIKSPSSVKIIQDKTFVIHLIKIETGESDIKDSASNKQPAAPTNSSNLKIQEHYLDVLGPVALDNKGYLAKHIGPASKYSYIRGGLLYSHGRHTIRFKIEECKTPYCIFFGCVSSHVALTQDVFWSPAAVGWFGSNQVYEHGRCSTNCKKYGYRSQLIQKKDVLRLTFDCDKKRMTLFNERLNTTCTLTVNTNNAPYPWQLLMVMLRKGDSVRILPNV